MWCWQGRRRNGAFQCHLRVSSDQRQCPVAISGVFYNLLMLHLVTRRKIMLVPNIVWPGFVLRDRGQRQRRGNINLGGTVLTLAHLTITGTLHRIRQKSGQISQHQLRFSISIEHLKICLSGHISNHMTGLSGTDDFSTNLEICNLFFNLIFWRPMFLKRQSIFSL